MARKTKDDAEKTRKSILRSALSLFAKKGYEHTTFNDIAARLKMTKGAVYWYFASKEALLVELVRLAMERFREQVDELLPEGELTFPLVAEMMVKNAELVVSDPKVAEFFLLMKCQIRWTDASMDAVRKNLMTDVTFGPRQAFKQAIENGQKKGIVRKDVNSEEVSTVAIAVWDGIVQAKIDNFLKCDMRSALEHMYAAMWEAVRG